MSALPHRTRRTPLTDDELLLFDLMFDRRMPKIAMRRDVYPLHMNVLYNHTLDDVRLREALESLERRGLARSTVEEGETLWNLTPLGGEQWELERQPGWDAYCVGGQKIFSSKRSTLFEVLSPRLETAEAYWEAALKSGLAVPCGHERRCWRLQNHRLIPWRGFPVVYLLAARGASWAESDPDWTVYEAHRTWWSDVTDLEKLRDETG